jgi:hypothetical protein
LLEKQARSITTLRDRLVDLRTGLSADEDPDLESWLQTLELMNMYDRWFSKEELQQLPFAVQKEELGVIWSGLVAEAKALLEQHADVSDPRHGSGHTLDGAPGAGYSGKTGVSDPSERDAQR